MDINKMEWHVEYPNKYLKEVKVELTTPISSDITCHDLYFLLKKYSHIRKYPRRFKKAFFYGTKNDSIRRKIQKEIYKYCVITEEEV